MHFFKKIIHYCIATFCNTGFILYNTYKNSMGKGMIVKMEDKKTVINHDSIIDMVQIALMSAIVYVCTAFINVPYGVGVKAVVHFGDSAVFIAAMLLGKRKAALSSAIGMSLFDILSPYAIWAPFTFLIKGIMGYIAGTIAYRKNYNGKNFWNNVFAFSCAGAWMIAAYFAAGIILNHLMLNYDFVTSTVVSAAKMPADLLQVAAGIIIALPVGHALKRAGIK